MKKTMKFVGLLLVTALFAGLFAACQNSAPSENAAASNDAIIVELEAADMIPLGSAPAISNFLAPVASGTTVKENGKATFDVSNTKDGYIMIKYTEGDKKANLKVQIVGPSGTKYTYDLKNTGDYETYPLSDGNGEYTVGAFKQVDGSKYAQLQANKITVKLSDEYRPFLYPNQYVNFSESGSVAKTAKDVCKDTSNELDKVAKVYDYVINNLKYDSVFAEEVVKGGHKGYVPDVEKVLANKKGVCFDYAALMAAMLRSQGVPTKLVIGWAGDVYHAWISTWSAESGWIEGVVFFDGSKWTLMDPTFASTSGSSDAAAKFVGEGNSYKAQFLY